ncbi:hypothetical protein GCM10022221_40810 [Actinocorallia aurea]
MRTVLKSVVLGGLAAAALTACSFSATTAKADEASVEQQISAQLAPQLGGTPQAVDCPGDLTGTLGATLSCTLTTAEGMDRPVIVTVTSTDDGVIDFSIEAPAV